MACRKWICTRSLSGFSAGSLPHAGRKQFCAALRKAATHAETLGSGANGDSLVIEKARQGGVEFASPIN